MVNSSMSLAISTLVFEQKVTFEKEPPSKPTCHTEYTLEETTSDSQCNSESMLCYQCTAYFAPFWEIPNHSPYQSVNVFATNDVLFAAPTPLYRPPKPYFS
jgi:hypothetical protein